MNDFDDFENELQREDFPEMPEDTDPCCLDNEPGDSFRNDVEADADTLASAGFGLDEDYCHDTPMGEEYGNGFDNGDF